jgi:hypothetical protein
VGVGTTDNPINTDPEQSLRLNSKTNIKNDDEVFAGMISKLDAACEKMTGKRPSIKDAEKWEMLADLLILELEIAAKRTGSVSSVPAFLTEVLRRKLLVARSIEKNSKAKIDPVGKTETGKYEIKPLNAKEKEEALEQLKEFKDEDFLDDFKKWYTPSDWEWIIKNLK